MRNDRVLHSRVAGMGDHRRRAVGGLARVVRGDRGLEGVGAFRHLVRIAWPMT